MLDLSKEPPLSFVQETVRPFEAHASQKRISLGVMRDTSIHVKELLSRSLLNIDAKKMAQVLRNFVSNALKFTPEGGTVDVRLHHKSSIDENGEKKNILRVEVTDSGAPLSFFYLGLG